MLRVAGWIVVAVVFAASAYELALALGAGTGHVKAGDDPPLSATVSFAVLVALLAGVVLGVAYAGRPRRVAALLGPAAAAFLLGNRRRPLDRVRCGLRVRSGSLDGDIAQGGRRPVVPAILLVLPTLALVGDGH